MSTGLELIDRSRNRDRFRYNWRRAQVLTNPKYISKRAEKEKEVEEIKIAKAKKKASKPDRDKEKLAEKEAKKVKKAKAKEAKEKEEILRKEAREKKRKAAVQEKEEAKSKKVSQKPNELFCWCKKKLEDQDWVGCDGDVDTCPGRGWYHSGCLRMSPKEVKSLPSVWYCMGCCK
jgi:hypothetical protein